MEERKNGEAAPSVGRDGGMQVCVEKDVCGTLTILIKKSYIYIYIYKYIYIYMYI